MEIARMKKGPSVATPFRERKEARNRNLVAEYNKLMAENPGRSRVMVKDYLKEKYEISSDDVYYTILKSYR